MCVGGQFAALPSHRPRPSRYLKAGLIDKQRYSNHQKVTTPFQLGIDMTRNSEAEKGPKVVKTTDVCGIEMLCVRWGLPGVGV